MPPQCIDQSSFWHSLSSRKETLLSAFLLFIFSSPLFCSAVFPVEPAPVSVELADPCGWYFTMQGIIWCFATGSLAHGFTRDSLLFCQHTDKSPSFFSSFKGILSALFRVLGIPAPFPHPPSRPHIVPTVSLAKEAWTWLPVQPEGLPQSYLKYFLSFSSCCLSVAASSRTRDTNESWTLTPAWQHDALAHKSQLWPPLPSRAEMSDWMG